MLKGFNGFISNTSPPPSPEKKKTKITAPKDFPLLLQALGYTWLENYSRAVDNLIGLCAQDYGQLSIDDLQQVTRMFEKLSFHLKIENNYEALQRLQQIAQYFVNDENIPSYVLLTANENNDFLQKHKDIIQAQTPAMSDNHSELLAQAVGYFELSEGNYEKGIAKLNQFYFCFRQELPSDNIHLINIYHHFSRSIFSALNLPAWKALQQLFHRAMMEKPIIRAGMQERYTENNLLLRYHEFRTLFLQGRHQEAVLYFVEIYSFISKYELLDYYMVLSDYAGHQLAKIQSIATHSIKSQDSIYLTKYYYKEAILASNNHKKCIEALKTCIEHAKESSSTARQIHACLAQLQTRMSDTEFAAYKQKIRDGFYFGIIDNDQRTLHEWTYFDHKEYYPQEWLLLRNVVINQINHFKNGKILEKNFVENMNHVLNIIDYTKTNPEECKHFYNNPTANEFHDEHPNFLEKFENDIIKNMPQPASDATAKVLANDPSSPTLSVTASSVATSEANAVLTPQIKLSQ